MRAAREPARTAHPQKTPPGAYAILTVRPKFSTAAIRLPQILIFWR